MIIVIDGPAGSGKSSTAKAIAEKMNIEYLDSGALYRALTWMYIQANQDKDAFFNMLNQSTLAFSYTNRTFYVRVDEQDITQELRTSAVADLVSTVASFNKSRVFVNDLMQKAVQTGQYIAEGRDLGTAVFPSAELKFFMEADMEERARRRHNEMKASGVDITLNDVRINISKRDEKDSNRKTAPLKKAPDAIEVDTTEMDFDEQVQHMCSIINERTELTDK